MTRAIVLQLVDIVVDAARDLAIAEERYEKARLDVNKAVLELDTQNKAITSKEEK